MEQNNTRSIEGDVVSIQFKDDRNGKEFVTVAIQQDGLTYPTNVRSRDGEILQRMANANKHIQSGKVVRLGVEVRESPRAEGGYFRDIIRITNASLDDVPQEPTPNGSPQSARPGPSPVPWGTQPERISWNSGINNAFSKTEFDEKEMTWIEYLKTVDSKAHDVELLIARGPMPESARQQWYELVWDAPERPQEAPEDAPSSSAGPLGEEGQHPADSDDGVFEV